jgi:hypothetical protein
MNTPLRPRKDLNADALFAFLRKEFEKIPDTRPQPIIPLADALMSGFALFSLKAPSLLAFEKRTNDITIKNLYHIGSIPSDTNMRMILDEVDPTFLMPIFKRVLSTVQRGKGLEDMTFYDGYYLISNDGTGYFSSDSIHCDDCLIKKHAKGIEYHHSFLGSVMVHPKHKTVLPLCPEPIKKSDGQAKNDCEQNASKRWIERFRREHPHMKAIIVEDALSSTAPHIQMLKENDLRYIIGIKPKSHKYLFALLNDAAQAIQTHTVTDALGTIHTYQFMNNVSLNESQLDTKVNVIEYWETKPAKGKHPEKRQHFSWVTDIVVTKENVALLAKGGRSRWKIENETFNTLKNQGYHFEHNFGHGNKHLSTVFALLMMLAFLIDQIQQKCCPVFQAAWAKCGDKRTLWERIRGAIEWAIFSSMIELLTAIHVQRKYINAT